MEGAGNFTRTNIERLTAFGYLITWLALAVPVPPGIAANRRPISGGSDVKVVGVSQARRSLSDARRVRRSLAALSSCSGGSCAEAITRSLECRPGLRRCECECAAGANVDA